MEKKTIITILKYVIGLGLGIGLLYMALSGVNFDDVKGYFLKANYWWVAIGLVVALLSHWFRALRWKQLIKAAGHESNTMNLFASLMVGYMVNQAVPRAGEVTRVTLGAKVDRYPLSVGFGTLVTDRIFDVICLGLLVLTVVALQFDQIKLIWETASAQGSSGAVEESGGMLKWILLGAVVLIGLLLLVFWSRLKQIALFQKVLKFAGETWEAVKSVRKMENPLLFIFYTIAIWGCYILMTYLVFFSLEETQNLSFMFALTAFTMGGIGMVIPSPGGIGSYHFAISMSFVAYAVVFGWTVAKAEEVGISIAFIIHTSQLVMMIVVGFLAYLYLVPQLRVAPELEDDDVPKDDI